MKLLTVLVALAVWGSNDLILLSEEGDLTGIKEAVAAGADINKSGPSGILPLHAATRYGQIEVVRYLLKAGAPIDVRDEDGWTPLLYAVSEGQLKVLEILREAGADINAADNKGATALLMAATNEDLETVRFLLSVDGVNFSARDNEGRNAYDLVHYSANKTLRDLVRTKVQPGRAEAVTGVFSALADGKPLNLEAYRGKVVLLDFWATWCKPCHKAIPSLRKLQKKTKKSPFVLISISVDVSPAEVKAFVEKEKMNWPHYMDPRGKLSQDQYSIRAYPSYILLDEEGKQIFRDSGWSRGIGEELRRRVVLAIKKATNDK